LESLFAKINQLDQNDSDQTENEIQLVSGFPYTITQGCQLIFEQLTKLITILEKILVFTDLDQFLLEQIILSNDLIIKQIELGEDLEIIFQNICHTSKIQINLIELLIKEKLNRAIEYKFR
jgi:hypothetical protein